MGIIAKFIPLILQVLAGVGVGEVLDKFAADKLPASPGEPISPGFGNTKKLLWFVISMVAGAIVFRFIASKLKIKF
jgi:hypothetical protein